LQEQAGNLSQVVGVFKLDRRQSAMYAQERVSQSNSATPKIATEPVRREQRELRSLPTRKLASTPAAASSDWEEF
jgi:hypothetical protein